ncbi:MAG: hypothetical protein ACTSQJ_11960 [Promethearchaeota archaeon]
MPLLPDHIIKFLEHSFNDKTSLELLNLLIKRINQLCFEECQIDRVACTLTPMCTRRFLLKLRIKNGLSVEDLPQFCYSVHKGIIERDFRNKTVVYKPFDAYLYIIDFLDIFFHGDYRKLNKFISFKNFDEAKNIFNYRRNHKNENFDYYFGKNYIIFKFGERVHIMFLKDNYVLCNANRENIPNLELLYELCRFYNELYFQDVKVNLVHNDSVEIILKIPEDILLKVQKTSPEKVDSKSDLYFWDGFAEDLQFMMQFCKEIKLEMDQYNNLSIKLYIRIEGNNSNVKKEKIALKFRDLKILFNFVNRIYNDYYVIWLK